MKLFRQFFLVTFFSFLLIIITLSIARHYYLGGPRMQGRQEIFNFLSDLLTNAIHFIKNKGAFPDGILIDRERDINIDEFNVKGLFPYLTLNGWVILDQMEKSNKIIPIEWEKFKKKYHFYNKSDENIDTKYAAAPLNPVKLGQNLIFTMGSVLFKYNYLTKSIKAFKGNYHHTIEPFQDTLIYTCIIGEDTLPIRNDAIMVMNLNTMKPTFVKSISEILIENGYAAILYGSSKINKSKTSKDIIHLNDIQPVRRKTNFAQQGDILISMRHLSTVMLYRPSNNKILWLSQGPWLNQHDVDVINENEIGVYNNNYIKDIGFYKNESSFIVTYNFKNKQFRTLHKKTFEKYQIKSKCCSLFEILDNGNIFIEDSQSGTYYLLNPNGKLISRKSFKFKNNLTSTGRWSRPYTSKLY